MYSQITICSQNLNNFGLPGAVGIRSPKTISTLTERKTALVDRFQNARCDIVAVQELLGRDFEEAQEALGSLAEEWSSREGQQFQVVVGETNAALLHLGFIIDTRLGSIEGSYSFRELEIPSLHRRPRSFLRGPFQILLSNKGVVLNLITFHFKSRGGWDPAGLKWETFRMEMAEALHKVASSALSSGAIVILLGDRNSDASSASAAILRGNYSLSDFQKGQCKVLDDGAVDCEVRESEDFTSLITPQSSIATYHYKNSSHWFDDIVISKDAIQGVVDSGVLSEPRKASDHSLVFAEVELG